MDGMDVISDSNILACMQEDEACSEEDHNDKMRTDGEENEHESMNAEDEGMEDGGEDVDNNVDGCDESVGDDVEPEDEHDGKVAMTGEYPEESEENTRKNMRPSEYSPEAQ